MYIWSIQIRDTKVEYELSGEARIGQLALTADGCTSLTSQIRQ